MPTISFIKNNIKKDFVLRDKKTEQNALSVVKNGATYFLDLTTNKAIADTTLTFVKNETRFYPKVKYDLVFPEQHFRGYNSYSKPYPFTFYFEQSGSRFEVFISIASASIYSGAKPYEARLYCRVTTLSGPKPSRVQVRFRSTDQQGFPSAFYNFEFPAPDGRWEYSSPVIQPLYLYSDLYLGMTAYMS